MRLQAPPPNTFSSQAFKCILPLLVALIPATVFYQTLSFDFTYDDVALIVYNPLVSSTNAEPKVLTEILSSATYPGNLYRPVSTLSYKFNFLLSQLNPGPYHALNLLLHIICCLLIYYSILFFSGSVPASAASALLFGIHPVNVETVANISGRSEILAAVFGLSSMILLTATVKLSDKKNTVIFCLAGALLLMLAELSKESAFVFVVIIPLFLTYAGRFPAKSSDMDKPPESDMSKPAAIIALVIPSLLVLVFRMVVLRDQFLVNLDKGLVLPENPIHHLGFFYRIIPAFNVLGEYIKLLVCPIHLSADYSRVPADFLDNVYSPAGLAAAALPLILSFFIFLSRKKAFSLWGIWYFAAFIATCNIIVPIGTVMGERLAYTPAVGFITFAVFGVEWIIKFKNAPRVLLPLLFCVCFIFFASSSLSRIPVWRNNEVLFTQTIKDAPESPKAYFNYGVYLQTVKKDLKHAEIYYKTALKIDPDYMFALRALADISLRRNDPAALEGYYRRILKITPSDAEVRDKLKKLLRLKVRKQTT